MNDSREYSCCFTGHRQIPSSKYDVLRHKLEIELRWLLAHGICHFYNGGALGFDTMSAEAVITMKPSHPELKLHLTLPCPEQTKYWKPTEIEHYRHIICQADSVWYADDHYYAGTMIIRNKYMVEHCRYCICYYDAAYAEQESRKSYTVFGKNGYTMKKHGSGTLFTVDYARQQGLSIINLCDEPPVNIDFDFDE